MTAGARPEPSTAGARPEPDGGGGGLEAAFRSDLVAQVRAGDPYGRTDRLTDGQLLDPYLAGVRPAADVPLPCLLDPAAVERVRAFHRAVAAGVERLTGLPTECAVDLDAEGFGRAVLFTGRLVLLCQALRDVNGFGFRDTGQLAGAGAALVRQAAAVAHSDPAPSAMDGRTPAGRHP